MMKLYALIEDLAQRWPSGLPVHARVEVGLSGGLDSVVLLHALAQLRERVGFSLSAVHVHHGLNMAADDWVVFCQRLCQRLDVPLRVEHVRVTARGKGLEGAARSVRYQAFADGEADVLALAHHADDQVETFMLAALRGGGVRALAAMPLCRALNERTMLWRPLLSYSRADLQAYAQAHGLEYVNDSSNADTRLLRNWLRHEGLPAWRARMPQLNQQVAASVQLLQDEHTLLAEITAADLRQVLDDGRVHLPRWRALSEVRRRRVLLQWVQSEGLGQPTYASVLDFARVLRDLGQGAAQWRLPNGEIYAYGDYLFVKPDDFQEALPWLKRQNPAKNLQNVLENNGFTLKPHLFGLRKSVLMAKGAVRVVNAADILNLAVGQKNVKKLLQECKTPLFARRVWPVIVDESNVCVAVANIWVSVHHGCENGILPTFDKFNRYVLEQK